MTRSFLFIHKRPGHRYRVPSSYIISFFFFFFFFSFFFCPRRERPKTDNAADGRAIGAFSVPLTDPVDAVNQRLGLGSDRGRDRRVLVPVHNRATDLGRRGHALGVGASRRAAERGGVDAIREAGRRSLAEKVI